MNLLSAAEATSKLNGLIVPLLLGIGAATFIAIGLYRAGSIAGPKRIEDNEPLEPLAIAMGIGMMVYFLGLAFSGMPSSSSTTQPTTEPVLTEAGIVVELFSRAAGAITIYLVLVLFYRGARKLGILPDKLPMGLATGSIAMLVVVPIMILAIMLTTLAMRQKHEYVHPFLKMLTSTQDEAGRDVILVSILGAAPVSEELFFRVCLQTLLAGWVVRLKPAWTQARSRWIAVILTSALFAAAHVDPWAMGPIFVLSLCLGYAYERTGNMWTNIVMHAAFNAWQLWLFEKMMGSQ